MFKWKDTFSLFFANSRQLDVEENCVSFKFREANVLWCLNKVILTFAFTQKPLKASQSCLQILPSEVCSRHFNVSQIFKSISKFSMITSLHCFSGYKALIFPRCSSLCSRARPNLYAASLGSPRYPAPFHECLLVRAQDTALRYSGPFLHPVWNGPNRATKSRKCAV